jgi:hypothetical protein
LLAFSLRLPFVERSPAKGAGARCVQPGGMRRAWYALLVLPFVGTLIPQFYNHARPTLFGMPFFYWYQVAWIVITAGLLGLVVGLTREPGDV